MVRDRGNIKWVSMMLPEHVSLLKEYKNSLQEVDKPALDEQKYEEFNEVIARAEEENVLLAFIYYQKGKFEKVIGQINQIDHLNGDIFILDKTLDHHKLKIDDVIEISII